MDPDSSVPNLLPSAKSGRPPPTLAKFSSSGPSTGLGGQGQEEAPPTPRGVWLGLSSRPGMRAS
eukprot:scaffold990_cov118-Isochrysis_galbana.AAC.2